VASLASYFIDFAVMGVGRCLAPSAIDDLTLDQVPVLLSSTIVAMVGLFGTVRLVVWVMSKRSIVVWASRRDGLKVSATASH
jgi:hypothetical protein